MSLPGQISVRSVKPRTVFSGGRYNPAGSQEPSRFRLLIWLFVGFASMIFLFAILSQPIGILTGILTNAYPTIGAGEGQGANSGVQTTVELALGAAVVIGVLMLIFFFGFRNLGGGNKNAFG